MGVDVVAVAVCPERATVAAEEGCVGAVRTPNEPRAPLSNL